MKELIEKSQSGDSNATLEIINKYMPLIISEASKYKIPGFEFEDLVQHSILSIIKGIKLYEIGGTSFSSFIAKVVKNNNINLLKNKIKHNREVQSQELIDQRANEISFTIEDEVMAYDMVKNLNKAMEKLEDREKQVITDFYIKKKRLKDIANEQGVTYRQMVTIKEKALSNVKKLL